VANQGPNALRNLQSLFEIGVDKNTTVVFPAPPMNTIGELGAFLARESAAAGPEQRTAGADTASGVPALDGDAERL
jgi:hypothetical protein